MNIIQILLDIFTIIGFFCFLFFISMWSDYLLWLLTGWSWLSTLENLMFERFGIDYDSTGVRYDDSVSMSDIFPPDEKIYFPALSTYNYCCTGCSTIYPIHRNQETLVCPHCGRDDT
jgi:hypothetical protein